MLFKLGEYPCPSGSSFASFAVFTPQPRRQSPSPRLFFPVTAIFASLFSSNRPQTPQQESEIGCELPFTLAQNSIVSHLNRYPNLSSLALRYKCQTDCPHIWTRSSAILFFLGYCPFADEIRGGRGLQQTLPGLFHALWLSSCLFGPFGCMRLPLWASLSGPAQPIRPHRTGLSLVPTIRRASRLLLQPKNFSLGLAS